MLFDTHAHLDDEQFEGQQAAILKRAQDAGVCDILCVGVTASSSQSVARLASQYDGLHAAVGIQPNYCHEVQPGDWDEIVRLSESPPVIALGETGLDCYWDWAPLGVQQDYFDRHLRLSQNTGLPFIVHMRESGTEILAMLQEARKRGELRGVMHSFTGDQELAAACLDLGLYISFAGMATFKKSQALRETAAAIPADRILLETDAPYLSPHPHRGKRPNEPALMIHTAACLAETREVSPEMFAAQTRENARRLFRLQEN